MCGDRPSSTLRHIPVAATHTCTVPSYDTKATSCPSDDKVTAVIESEWLFYAPANSRTMMRMWLSLSHSSTTTTYGPRLVQLQQRAESKVLPLIAQRLADNVAALCNSVAAVLAQCRYAVPKLDCYAGYKLVCMANVAVTAREEKESWLRDAPFVVHVCDRPYDCQVACARHAAQLEVASFV